MSSKLEERVEVVEWLLAVNSIGTLLIVIGLILHILLTR